MMRKNNNGKNNNYNKNRQGGGGGGRRYGGGGHSGGHSGGNRSGGNDGQNLTRQKHHATQMRETAASVSYERPRNVVVDIHSHGAISAFFSTTDDQDDQGLKISIVVGHLDKSPWYPDGLASRVCVYGYYALVAPVPLFNTGEDV